MIRLKITLLYGEEPHKTYTIQTHQTASYASLQQEIKNSFHIHPRYQQIYFRGEELTVVEHPFQSAEDDEEITIKHSLYNHWLAFEQHSQNAREAALSNTAVGEHASLAFSEYRYLNSSQFFFLTFPHLSSSVNSFLATFHLYEDSEFEPITLASKAYFLTLYGDDPVCPKLSFKWERRKSRKMINWGESTLRCHVYREETLLKIYHVRTHRKLAQQHYSGNHDLRKLFMYKLLEILGLGPKVHFYRNSGQHFGFYTASEGVPDYEPIRFRSDATTKISPLYYPVRLLCCCFYLRDLLNDDRNSGVDSDGRLKIVHFGMRSHTHATERQAANYCSYKGKKSRNGIECFSQWNLQRCIDMADKAIENEKNLFQRYSITFEENRDYDQYLTKIKKNVQYITVHCHKLESEGTLFALCLRLVDPNQIPFRL